MYSATTAYLTTGRSSQLRTGASVQNPFVMW